MNITWDKTASKDKVKLHHDSLTAAIKYYEKRGNEAKSAELKAEKALLIRFYYNGIRD